MKFNRDIFFTAVRPLHWRWCKTGLVQSQVDGLEFLIGEIERDPIWTRIENVAYALATTAWETAWTFQPIEERGSYAYFERRYGFQTKIGRQLGNDAPGEGAKYHGKGDVQLTGETNYENAENRLRRFYPQIVAEFESRTLQKFDLTDSPEQAKDPAIAYAVLALGMHEGWFTGKKFSTYKIGDYPNYRKIINGLDHKNEIAAIAEAFEKALRSSFVTQKPEQTAQIDNPTVNPAANPANIPPTSAPVSQSPAFDTASAQSVQPSQAVEGGGAGEAGTDVGKERPSSFVKIWTAIVAAISAITGIGVNVQAFF